MSTSLSPPKGPSLSSSTETVQLIVRQPAKLQELGNLLLTIENLSQRVSERAGEDHSGDMGGATGAGGTQGDDGTQITPRDQHIATMPTDPAVIRTELTHVIRKEMRQLERQARKAEYRLGRPGSAFVLNELYARIRRLNALLAEILQSSLEVLRRFFIRVFIDQQPIL